MPYQETASQIIKESIKSAIFIDEQALPFYGEAADPLVYEERLSKELFNNFKEKGISLAIHRFQVGDQETASLKNYLFDRRDLVLLDWKLDGEEGEAFSLKLLADVVSKPSIHFCVIYTSETSLNNIYSNILSYFSGRDRAFYDSLREEFEPYEEVLSPLLSDIDVVNYNNNGQYIGAFSSVVPNFIKELTTAAGGISCPEAMKYLKIAFENFIKAESVQVEPEYDLLSVDQRTMVINNTIISIVNKNADNNASADADSLLGRFADLVIASKNSFSQLLGLEMQSTFASKSSFLDSSLLKVSKEALMKHRKALVDKEETDLPFKNLIKSVLIEQASMSLRLADLALLDNTFLDELTVTETGAPTDDALMEMNVFYNSTKLKIGQGNPRLNFGDVFMNDGNEYFICITALCDCLRPDKIKSNYFFAKGRPIPVERALKLGDSAFISFISKDIAVSWVPQEEEEDQESYRYRPVYIKPLIYNVKSPSFIEDSLEIRRLLTKEFSDEEDKGDFDWQTIDYVTTIRPNYTQRIANHTFTYPMRVGVEFVRK